MNNYKDLNDYEVMYMIGEKSDDATNLLFEKYMPLIEKVAREYYKYGKELGLEYEDFVQEGYLGLNTAIKKYNDSKNCLFYTYVMICVKSRISNLVKRNDTKKNFALNKSVSLFSNIDNTDKELIEYISDEKAILPEEEVIKNEVKMLIQKCIYSLDIEKASVLELKYNGFSNREISRLLNITNGKVSYILSSIRKKLNY